MATRIPRRLLLTLAGITLVALNGMAPSEAHAHRLRVFATAEGESITGYAYFSGGGRIAEQDIQVHTPEGEVLGQVRTDKDGAFTFQATQPVDHVFSLSTSDGHFTEFTVRADELGAAPSNSPPPEDAPSQKQSPLERNEERGLETLVDKAVARQVRPLREQIDALSERMGMRDILGGMGYLFGLTGFAFYFLGVRRKEKATRGGD